MDEELHTFKTKINLSEYAASKGFLVDKKKSTKKSCVMRRDSEQIVISIGEKGYYIYFLRGPKTTVDSGTIIDFVQRDSGLTLGQVRIELRKWLGWKNRPKINPSNFVRINKRSSSEDLNLTKEFLELWDIDDDRSSVLSYLSSRGISKEIAFNERFKDRLRTDKYNNIIFPHYLNKDVIGWEIKNFKFTGFPLNSKKSVWFSNRYESDTALILFESGIEALSFYQLFPEYLLNSWCISTAGGWGPESEYMMELAFKEYPEQTIILGFNNDKEGYRYDNSIITLLKKSDDQRIPIIKKPVKKDWNDDLKSMS